MISPKNYPGINYLNFNNYLSTVNARLNSWDAYWALIREGRLFEKRRLIEHLRHSMKLLMRTSEIEFRKEIVNKAGKYANILVIPIHENYHWYCSIIYVREMVVVILDSLYKKVKTTMFKKVLRVCAVLSSFRGIKFNQSHWKLMQPTDIEKQSDA